MRITNRYKESLIFSILIILFALFMQPTLKSVDDSYTDVKFDFRGKQQIDTSIVILFFTDDDLKELGGFINLPNHTALIISALNNLGVSSIGINILFDEMGNYQSSERRHFISTVKSLPNISLACYFQNIGSVVDSLKTIETDNIDSTNKNFSPDFKVEHANLSTGLKLLAPYPTLIKNEQMGHLNYYGETVARKIPLVVKSSSGKIIPSFSLELMRVFLNIPKDSIVINENTVELKAKEKKISIPAKNGEMLINYSGSSENLLRFTVVEFLNAYINFLTGKTPGLPLVTFKNKIVLLAIDSKIQGQYLINPFNERMPIIGVQANAIDTILRRRFIYEFSPWVVYLISFIMLFIICYILLNFNSVISFIITVLLIVIYMALSFYLFSQNIQLPVHPILLAPLAVIISLIYKVGIIQRNDKKIETIENGISFSTDDKKLEKEENKPEIILSNIGSTSEEIDTQQYSEFNKINFDDVKKVFNGMVYDVTSPLNKIVETIKKIAPSNAAVLITGESGTGKELVAKSIHNLSHRKNQKYVAINCATIQETLLESELFGHEKGAFTGADKQKIGLFETANRGTLFLDEISEMSESLQSKLLRVLQSNEFYRVGSVDPIKIDVRIIAATNKDPKLEIRAKRFREDLFYRLNTILIELQPLSKRKKDISVLIHNFLEKENVQDFILSKDVFETLVNYNWPGNVRQLEGVVERAVIFAKSENRKEIRLKDLPSELTKNSSVGDLEENILELLRRKNFSRNSINETARELGGLHRGTVTEYIRGILLKELSQNNFDLNKVSEIMAGTNETKIINYVKKKNKEYIFNIHKHVNKKLSLEENVELLKKKYKNLPKRYHAFLEKFVAQNF